MLRTITALALAACVLACQPSTPPDAEAVNETVVSSTETDSASPAEAWVTELEAAHQRDEFHRRAIIQFNLELYFRGSKRLEGTITSRTNSNQVLLERADGAQVYYDGRDVYLSPADADWSGARFDVLTWQYFALAPFKFSDPGTQWELLSEQALGDATYSRGKLTFSAGTGDAPDDWYIAYRRPRDDRLHALAYIVTYGGRDAGAAEPHAISYTNYQPVDGIPFARNWEFWMWYEDEGLGEQLGEATVSNVRFLNESEVFANFPKAEAKLVPLPQ